MMEKTYYNQDILGTLDKITHEVCNFLSGWGNVFEKVEIEYHRKELIIKIKPKE